jgi:hypothetical protein
MEFFNHLVNYIKSKKPVKIENAIGVEPTERDMKHASEAIDQHVRKLCRYFDSGPRDDQFCYRVDIVNYQRFIIICNKSYSWGSQTCGGDEVFRFPA